MAGKTRARKRSTSFIYRGKRRSNDCNNMIHDPFLDNSGQPRRLRGMAVLSNSPWVAELAPRVGFDLVWFDMEHGSLGFSELGQLCQAVELAGGIPLVRTADAQRTSILRALEVGAQFIVVPMIEDVAQAEEIVQWSKYPPVGRRGFSSRSRGAGYGLQPMPVTLREANLRTHVFALLETQKGVEHVAEICAVEGLDGIFLGPGDLSFELGEPGAVASPRIIDKMVHCVRMAGQAGKHVGMFSAPGPLLTAALEAGLDIAVPGADIGYLATAWSKLLESLPTSPAKAGATVAAI
jgi:4-hydroxy-2-oxoheptanedioate aldolase